ncbi:predicted protein [Nematostella vectensis]|uniref:DNA polymerase delta subunit 4 n=1 Tax=Nematostella vectensis TaxID=45351 RepID=A7S4K3_NEMVE|nr:predicted protein [Nematostella vectensis]|eukprot:XP_001633359.1 predicted protein [Nematostella vectensis]
MLFDTFSFQLADKDVSIDARQDDLKTLREFDLSPEFGPCLGMTRLERWERADRYGLNPPQDVKKILALHPTDSNYTDW